MAIRADTLDLFNEVLEVKPLTKDSWAFYSAELNSIRGDDEAANLALRLRQSFGKRYYRAFLAGHSGCGKSTELTRLATSVESQYRTIRFSAKDELDPASAEPFDVLLLMMALLGEQIARPVSEGGLAWRPSAALSQKVLDWFAAETVKETRSTAVAASVEAGAGMDGDSVWGKLLGLFAKIKGEVRFASQREEQVVQQRKRRLPELLSAANDFFNACTEELRSKQKKEWLFIGEDFEKLLTADLPQRFFVQDSALFSGLQAHFIFTIPIELAWAASGAGLPFEVRKIYDTPVYTKDNQPDKGRSLLRDLMSKRVDLNLFEPGQLDRLIVASGGNLRDLFLWTNDAADRALLAPSPMIRRDDVTRSIAKYRREALLRLGPSGYDAEEVKWSARLERLKAIYAQARDHEVPDAVL
ncbi:MAG: hypothetical protein FJW39_18045 [Acidobacteria bacterium]|nr:hypothetical protein [Acidobacteriota bacterium]